jgi:protein-S-isoprenylcysteine O-methyltransferase Ste14
LGLLNYLDEGKGSENMRRKTKDNILMIILGITFFVNIIAINLSVPIIEELAVVGWIIFGVGALFYVLSVFTLHRKGVSNIVDSGIYGIVRHPMYLGAMLMFFSHVFLGQNWIVAIGTIVAIACCYLIILSGDQQNIEKFGDDYKRYMEKIPRMNFVAGVIRLLRRRLPTHQNCANFSDGNCTLNDVTVNTNGTACSKFTPTNKMKQNPREKERTKS